MGLIITGAVVIDGASDEPLDGYSIWIEAGRIRAVDRQGNVPLPPGAQVIDASGKYVIPGLMNANVHLLADVLLETLARYRDRYEDLIAEAAQVALRSGLTTVFDTWGPRRFLTAVRDRINAGEIPGSRIFCGGNIIGFDGPYSADFVAKTPEVASRAFVRRINAIWVENVGRHLMWLTPDQVARELRAYIGRGIDFIKYASNDHAPGAYLAFSPKVQTAMVEEAHRAGLTAQAHTMTVEGLRIAIEAGCDLIQHANITGPTPIPEETLELLTAKQTGAVVFPFTQRRFESIMQTTTERSRTMWRASDVNVRHLMECGAKLLMANDAGLFAPEVVVDPLLANFWGEPGEDRLIDLARGHIAWFRAMEEKGCPPMAMVRAATINIARAYGKDRDLGTLEAGKIADLIILDRNPLQAAENYRSIHQVIKDGKLIDRDALPLEPLLSRPMQPPAEEEASYVEFLEPVEKLPPCPACMRP
jgi:imidazolonepropionase-like amidohydrolase